MKVAQMKTKKTFLAVRLFIIYIYIYINSTNLITSVFVTVGEYS